MHLYETIFVTRQEMSPAQVETLAQSFIEVLTEHSGTTGKTEYCGLRTLAYPIKKNTKGHYVLMNITASPKALQEFERRMRLNEDILRYMSVKVDRHEEGPSSLLKASRYGREETEREHAGRPPRTPSGRAPRPESAPAAASEASAGASPSS